MIMYTQTFLFWIQFTVNFSNNKQSFYRITRSQFINTKFPHNHLIYTLLLVDAFKSRFVEMKSIFLYTKQEIPMDLQKISACLYYDPKSDCFFRLNVMPTCTLFVSQDVEERKMMALTKYDATFHMIQTLYNNKKIREADLPQYFRKRNWKNIANQENAQGITFYSFNKQKVFDLLQKKAQMMEKYLDEKNPLDRLKLIKINEKSISSDTITLLKNQLDPDLVSDFVKERYNAQQRRKMTPTIEQPQALKPKPSGKNNKKSSTTKEIQRPKDQKTLLNLWVKK